MSTPSTDPFDSIESAHEFMILLEKSIEGAIREVQTDHHEAKVVEQGHRRVEALALALYKMNQLNTHVQKSRRILNDLRSIRRLLLER